MLHIWSFDPGETTGWCHLSVHEGTVSHFSYGETDHIGVGNMLFENQALATAAKKSEIELVFVCESYVQRPGKSPAPWSLETIGLLRYWTERNGVPFILQQPAEAKSLIKNDTIKRAGLWVVGQDHARDAVRHALRYLIIGKGLLTECLLPLEQKLETTE